MTDGKAIIAYLHPGDMPAGFHLSVIGLLMWDLQHHRRILDGGGHFPTMSGANIVNARNQTVRVFLDNHDAEWLFLVDSDMVFDPDTLDRLVDAADPHERPIVGGLYFGQWVGSGQPQVFPQLFHWREDGLHRATAWPTDELYAVGGTGAGCLLIHRRVLEELRTQHPEPWPWFQETRIGDQPISEDLTFCMRAIKAGFPIYVHTGIEAGHVKPHILTSASYQGAS